MAGLFSSGEQDLLGNIVQQRQQANQALGSGYGKYGGIVQAAAGMADVGADAITGGMMGSSDPRMQQLQGAKAIFTKVAKETGEVDSPEFYEKVSQELRLAGYPEQAQKAADEAIKKKKQGYEMGAMERDANYRKELAALGANPTTAQLAALDQKYGNVEGVRAAATAAEAKAEKKAVTEKEAKRIKTIAEALVKRDPKLPLAFAEVIAGDAKALMDFVNPKVKTTFRNVGGRVGMYNSETGDLIKDIGAAGDSDVKALAGSVAALAQSMGEKAAENLGAGEGKAAAEQTALIQGKEDALSSIREAKNLLKSKDGKYNIFTGGWASVQKGIAKFGGGIVGNKEKLANTQKYISYIGNTVIPRLKEFGGNDSNQELAFLEGVMGGDTSFEPEALEGILDSAEKKIVAGIKRTQENQKLISQGKPVSTKVEGMGQRTTRTLKSGVVVVEEEEK